MVQGVPPQRVLLSACFPAWRKAPACTTPTLCPTPFPSLSPPYPLRYPVSLPYQKMVFCCLFLSYRERLNSIYTEL